MYTITITMGRQAQALVILKCGMQMEQAKEKGSSSKTISHTALGSLDWIPNLCLL